MPDSTHYERSLELMSADDSLLLVVDVQEKLMPLVSGQERIVWNIGRLLDGARVLGVPSLATEQYPRGLGPTVPALASRLGAIPAKLAFSCLACDELRGALASLQRWKVLIAGIEAHVCVQQTALDLVAAGYRVYVAVDAVGARYEVDYRTALSRMESCGVTMTTVEAALFEWCRVSGTPQFKEISALVRQAPPA